MNFKRLAATVIAYTLIALFWGLWFFPWIAGAIDLVAWFLGYPWITGINWLDPSRKIMAVWWPIVFTAILFLIVSLRG